MQCVDEIQEPEPGLVKLNKSETQTLKTNYPMRKKPKPNIIAKKEDF